MTETKTQLKDTRQFLALKNQIAFVLEKNERLLASREYSTMKVIEGKDLEALLETTFLNRWTGTYQLDLFDNDTAKGGVLLIKSNKQGRRMNEEFERFFKQLRSNRAEARKE